MNKSKPKGKTPSLIGGSNGRPRRVDIKRKSECSRCHVSLLNGKTCIEIPKVGGAFARGKRVCDECFQDILTKTEEDLREMRQM